MTRREEISAELADLQFLLDDTSGTISQEVKNIAAATMSELQKELDDLIDNPSPEPEPVPEPPKGPSAAKKKGKTVVKTEPIPEPPAPAPPIPAEGKTDLRAAVIIAIKELMDLGRGSGVDSDQVQGIIKEYLAIKKITLEELDKSVLEEIKRNQTVVLEIPRFGLKVSLSKEIAEIPNIFSIIDDVLAGNNVMLIGEAGGGKTFTAEKVAQILKRKVAIINCSQYTSPVEILGGQTIEGYKDGKLIVAWREGYILILDEMAKLDSNTAGLFNDALAKSTKTTPSENAMISTANPEEPPIQRNNNFGVIATANIYANKPPQGGYVGNNQQDLSLLDRFSGSVYFVEFSNYIDQSSCRYKFLYDFLVGNYHEYIAAVRDNKTPGDARGLRTIIEKNNYKNMALMSYRTITAFRVAFEMQLVRAFQKKAGQPVLEKGGKTVRQTYENYLIAFSEDARQSIIRTVGTPDALERMARNTIESIVDGDENTFRNSLTDAIRDVASELYEESKQWLLAENYDVKGR